MSFVVQDARGMALTVGARVRVGDERGVVKSISDPDGDVDDEGRSIGINPSVAVGFDVGDDDSFTTYVPISGWGDYMREDLPFRCDDVEIES